MLQIFNSHLSEFSLLASKVCFYYFFLRPQLLYSFVGVPPPAPSSGEKKNKKLQLSFFCWNNFLFPIFLFIYFLYFHFFFLWWSLNKLRRRRLHKLLLPVLELHRNQFNRLVVRNVRNNRWVLKIIFFFNYFFF